MPLQIVLQTPVGFETAPWLAGLRDAFSDEASVRLWATGDNASADYALVWKTPSAFHTKSRGLRAVFALGAGVDSLLPITPPEIPLVRLDDAGMAPQMAAYVAREILARFSPAPAAEAGWAAERSAYTRAAETTPVVGILGLGVLGAHVAGALAALGFETHGWSRAPKKLPGVFTHTGADGLATMLPRCGVLVNLLPLTPETENILDARLFGKLPRGAYLVNVARGAHLVDADLLTALDSGRLSGATLDVFRTEPLPTDHPLRSRPGIRITPHISARTLVRPALEQIVAKIRMLENGVASEKLTGFVDRSRGY